MSARFGRRRLLGGVLGISVVGWALDLVFPGSKPTAVKAEPTVETTEQRQPPADVAQRAQRLLDRLQSQASSAYDTQGGPAVRRDLFALVSQAWAIQQALEPQVMSAPTTNPQEEVVEEKPFVETHVLHGVVDGPTALALINDVIVSKGGLVDGYEVVEIMRDRVRLRGPDEIVTLVITGPYSTAAPEPPMHGRAADKASSQINSLGRLVDYLKRRFE